MARAAALTAGQLDDVHLGQPARELGALVGRETHILGAAGRAEQQQQRRLRQRERQLGGGGRAPQLRAGAVKMKAGGALSRQL